MQESQTGPLVVSVKGADETQVSKDVDPFRDGYAGTVDVGTFILDADSTAVGEHFVVCVFSDEDEDIYTCTNGINHEKKAPEKIIVESPTGIGNSINGKVYAPTYYDDDGEIIPVQDNDVEQGDDSEVTSTDESRDQDTGINVNIGDNSDNNEVTIDQRSTLADTINYLVPKAGNAIKNTAREILN